MPKAPKLARSLCVGSQTSQGGAIECVFVRGWLCGIANVASLNDVAKSISSVSGAALSIVMSNVRLKRYLRGVRGADTLARTDFETG